MDWRPSAGHHAFAQPFSRKGLPDMLTFLGRLTVGRPWLVCAAWLLLALGVTLLAPPWDRWAQDDDVRFLPERCASVRGYALLEQAFPQEVYASWLIFALEREGK